MSSDQLAIEPMSPPASSTRYRLHVPFADIPSNVDRSTFPDGAGAGAGKMSPAIQFAGMLTPVSSMEGSARLIGELYPATYMLIISRGVFNKALGFADLHAAFWPLLVSVPVILGATIMLLDKQEK